MQFETFSTEWWFDLFVNIVFSGLYGFLGAKIFMSLLGPGFVSMLICLVVVIFTVSPAWLFVRARIPLWPYVR